MTKGNEGDDQVPAAGKQEEKPFELAPGFSDDFNSWLERAGVRSKGYAFICYVQRMYPDKTVRYLKTYNNEFPDLDEFAIEFGGGKYSIAVQVYKEGRKKEGTASVFYIDDSFNEKKRIADEAKQSEKISGKPSPAMNEAKQIVELVQSLLTTAQTAAKPANDITSIMRLASSLAEDSLRQNFRLVSQTRRKLLENFDEADFTPVPTAQPQEPPNPFIETIVGLIEQYAPTLLGGGPAADAVVKTAKGFLAAPAVQSITTNPDAMRRIINAVNIKYGPEKTRQLFGLIGFKL